MNSTQKTFLEIMYRTFRALPFFKMGFKSVDIAQILATPKNDSQQNSLAFKF